MASSNSAMVVPLLPAILEQARERFGLSPEELALVERDPALVKYLIEIIPLAQSSTTSLQRAQRAVDRLKFFSVAP